MMVVKYIIKMKMSTRPDLDYYYRGQSREGNPIFDFKRLTAKRYDFIEEAYRDMSILAVRTHDETLIVEKIKCKG